MLNTVVLIFISFFLLSCSDNSTGLSSNKSQNQKLPSYLVKETFNVGNNVFVRSLSLDEKNNLLWVGTSTGVVKVDLESGNVLETITRENGLANEYVFASTVDANGGVWFGTNGGGVSHLENKDWRTYFPMHGLADYWVYSFVEQPGEGMWIGTWAGLSRLDYKTGEFKNYLKELVNEWVYGLAIDGKNRLWVGTEGGVNMFDGKQWAVWTHKDGLGAANSKNLAFSTNTGLGTRSRHDLSVLALGKETYNPNYVFCIQIDGGDKVWAGTWGGGASYFDGKSWKNYTTDDGLSGNIVYSMFISGDLHWFGTNHGLSAFDGDNWVSLTRADGLLDSHVYAVVQDSKGRVWAGTRNGVALIEKTR